MDDGTGFTETVNERPMKNLKRVIPQWDELRALGNNKLFQLSILVPVIGYFIVFNKYIVDYLQIHSDFCKDKGCNVSWRITYFYFGLTFSGLGSVIYNIFCPEIVKRHPDASSFFDKEKLYYTHPHHLKPLIEKLELEYPFDYHDPLELRKVAEAGSVVGINEVHVLSGVMSRYYILLSYSSIYIRAIVFFLYTISIVILAVPTIATFLEVLRLTFSQAA